MPPYRLAITHLTQGLMDRFPRLPFFLSIARLDRPIGIALLLWPTLWALWIAAKGFAGWHLFLVFTLGTILTRSAGCIINDLADRNYDGQVKRTRDRPLVSGRVTVGDAFLFLGVLILSALGLVLTTNLPTVLLAIFGAIVATIYPFMKRYTYLPQVILGVAFSCGIPMAFTATGEAIPKIAWLLIIANLIWTVAYDTEYAMVDRDDDIALGLKSSAILFGDMDKFIIGILQLIFVGSLLLVAREATFTWPFYAGLTAACVLLIYQQVIIRDRLRDKCFAAFLNNHWVGLCIFVGIFVHYQQ